MFVPTVMAQNMKAGETTRASQMAKSISIPFKEYKLKNGLRVILSEDHSAPTYSISVTYNVGSRNEKAGRTGFAHLFEHMMFQGSENVGKGEHFILVLNNGGNMNGTTNADRTNYFQSMPINQLDLGLFLEADRMKSLAITQANLDNQRNAVQEERRLGVDNQPYGKTFEVLFDTAYDNFAYKHSTIGSMDDLNAATVEDVSAFFKMYYAPNNATVVLVGDFKSDEALAKIKKYFEAIPQQPAPPSLDTTEPAQNGERRKTIDDTFARSARVDIVYKIPQSNTPDWYALSVLSTILGSGQSSRLYQQLVKEKQLAVGAFASAQERRGPSLASIVAILPPTPNADTAAVEKAIYAEIERLKTEPVADWELEKVRMQLRRQRAQQLRSTLFRSILLGQYAVYYDDPGIINTLDVKFAAVTKEDIMRVARTYFKDTNRTVVTTMPAKKSGPTAGVKPAE
ncbi:MAG TPA: pitrilysin family protein [Pyrinomonadaceae bacterium]|nr:pitrilysin family protein [Pyrinomonadaceae bacterium]